MKLSRTSIEIYQRGQRVVRPSWVKTAVSLHGHSDRSREFLDFVPAMTRERPLVSALFERALAHRVERGGPINLAGAYWRPPVTPADFIASERRQIENCFDCPALTALTDHDTLDGPMKLRTIGMLDVPLSLEWTVPFQETFFHLGVHAIDPERSNEIAALLTAYTRRQSRIELSELLESLNESPETLIVLNHPLWDLAGVGQLRHEAILLTFLRTHRHRIHALELNGYRRWAENRRVLPLAEGFDMPIVTGGDRHGFTANAMINISDATCFAEFVRDLRIGRPSHCVLLPDYVEPIAGRLLQGAREVLGPCRGRPSADARLWYSRIFWDEDGVEISLASKWPKGGPLWLETVVRVTRLLGSPTFRSLFRLTLASEYSGM